MNGDKTDTPREIPPAEEPHKSQPQPLKDPATPSENNPVNPKTDE